MQTKAHFFVIQCLLIAGILFSTSSTFAQVLNDTDLSAKDHFNRNQSATVYYALNSRLGARYDVINSLDAIQHKQTDIYNLLNGKASKAGARRIIQLIEDLTQKTKALCDSKADKADLERIAQALQKEMDNLIKHIKDETDKITQSLITITSQTAPHQRIQILAEIKNEQKNIKERIAELSQIVQKIPARTSQNRQADMSKLVDRQSEINDDYEQIKNNYKQIQQKLLETKDIANRNLSLAILFFIIIIVALGAWVYFFINQQKKTKQELAEDTRIIVREQYDRLLEQLYIEEHEDGRLTADDLKKMSERVKKKVIRQNWAKRKIEDRPAFI